MPEGKEGNGKAADIYLGVVDIFAIILPGALFALVLWAVLKAGNTDFFKGAEFPEFMPAWLVFLIFAYVLGHFVSALGSWTMDFLYDEYYKHNYEFRKKKEIPSLRRRADKLIMEALGPELYKEGDNRLTWGELFLLLSNPAGTAKLDRTRSGFQSFFEVSLQLRFLASLFSSLPLLRGLQFMITCIGPPCSWVSF